jgi:hypothetical protein
MIAVTQIRHRHSEGHRYSRDELAAGRTGREAMRALKRPISDRVYRHLRADGRPERTLRERLFIQRGRLEPLEHTGSSDQSLPDRHKRYAHPRDLSQGQPRRAHTSPPGTT